MTPREQILKSRRIHTDTRVFGTLHTVEFNGRTYENVEITWNDDRLTEAADQTGTYPAERLGFVSMESFDNQRPAPKAPIRIDAKRYTVVTCMENMGMYELRLEGGRG